MKKLRVQLIVSVMLLAILFTKAILFIFALANQEDTQVQGIKCPTLLKTAWILMQCYPILFLYSLFNSTEPEAERYIPKGSRSPLITLQCTWEWMSSKGEMIILQMESYYQRNQDRNKLRRARRMAARDAPSIRPHRGKKLMRIIAMTVVAMNAENSNGEPIYVNQAHFDTDSRPVGIDNRCSACISHDIKDFEGPLTDVNRSIKGFGGVLAFPIKRGTIVWKWCDNQGQMHTFRIPGSYYIPQGKVRLLSPQHWSQSQSKKGNQNSLGTGETTTAYKSVLFWNSWKDQLSVPIAKNNNVATFHLAPGFQKFDQFCTECKIDYDEEQVNPAVDEQPVVSDSDEDEEEPTKLPWSLSSLWSRRTGLPSTFQEGEPEKDLPTERPTDFNLNGPTIDNRPPPIVIEEEEDRQPTTATAELLQYHQRWGHISFRKLQIMAKRGIIPSHLAKCPLPSCSSCMYTKATRRSWRSKSKKNYEPPDPPTRPGQIVSVDQLVSPTAGFIAQLTGRLTLKRYMYATVYVDHYSRYSYVYLQKTSTAEETIEGKKAFEQHMKQMGVEVSAYHADNGIFRANKWLEECRASKQTLTFAGVNAHYSNGMAERRIRSLQELARAMLIHASKRWPDAVTANLWPYAVRMANDVMNESPSLVDKAHRSPIQLASGSEVIPNSKHWKPFGCPVYVLANSLQSGSSIHHKWKERARVGIYLGRSPHHPRNVALVLNRDNGLCSPQFHVAFDPSFHTVKQDQFDCKWLVKANLFQTKKETKAKTTPTSDAPAGTAKRRMSDSEGASKLSKQRAKKKFKTPEIVDTEDQTIADIGNQAQLQQRDQRCSQTPNNKVQSPDKNEQGGKIATGRASDISERNESQTKVAEPVQQVVEAALAEHEKTNLGDVAGEIFVLQSLFPAYAGEHEMDPLYVFKAAADPDTMYMHEAQREKDWLKFKEAMQKEWDDQMSNGNFELIKRSDLPKSVNVLPSVWQMKRKRDIRTRKIKKYKARLNIDGSRMKPGRDFDQTYAPVASWNSIRTLLTMTALRGWKTKQIDYVLAFPQAPVERELYMGIPRGFTIQDGNPKDYALKLHRNVYGQPQSGRVWNQYLTKILTEKVGFTKSEVDECVFYRGQVMYVLYTDDSILAGPSEEEIDKVIEDIKKAKLDITIEGDLQDFLGVNIDRKPDGSIHLTQPHLIDQILKDLKMTDDKVKPKTTPASSSKLLSRHSESPDFDESFNYRSVIGKLNYLEKATRSDIAYITHQCARFTTCPKREHGEAIRWLARYLKGTRDKGLIMRPKEGRNLEVFVDADFAGNWDPAEWSDRDTARSRHGYIIMYAGCPIIWKSQLQNECTLSSTESEYTGLSYALREVIPLMELMKEMKRYGFGIDDAKAKVHCKVFEDNSGAIEIARVHKFRPRTKHINVKLHHFRSYVDAGKISIHKIGTDDQPSDFLTKPLNEKKHTKHRMTVMGW